MDFIVSFLVRGTMLLVGAWVGLCMVLGTTMIIYTWKRQRRVSMATHVVECPMCDGRGAGRWRDRNEVCPLCDGESALVERLPELDAG